MLPNNSLKAILINSARLTNEEFDDLIVMRGTGLNDINQVEIFEGDLLRCTDKDSLFYSNEATHYYYEIKWDKYRWNSFPITNQNEDDFRSELNAFGSQIMWPDSNVLNNHWHYEIVGNIYETPEMLNKSVYDATCF